LCDRDRDKAQRVSRPSASENRQVARDDRGDLGVAAAAPEGFVVLPRRWVVEHTFSWFGRNPRLAKDFENLAGTLAAFVTVASDGSPGRRS